MKLRTLGDLHDHLDTEVAWRKKEITNVRLLIADARAHELEMLIRAGVCLLYAHWEGFVKGASTAYLNYVAFQRRNYEELSTSFIALGHRGAFNAALGSSRISLRMNLTEALMHGLSTRANIPWEDAVDTRSNLNSEVLSEIICLVNIDGTKYDGKKNFLDVILLKSRNEIAHGERRLLDMGSYNQLHDEVFQLIEWFRNDVENAAANRAYMRQ